MEKGNQHDTYLKTISFKGDLFYDKQSNLLISTHLIHLYLIEVAQICWNFIIQ